ncbi:lonely Cys domain-containing protein, partial [Streptomyces sparsogenes]|uniref:lonely Cys domain-containing protein n=1 Tax=Streptomyces sparsogenes TaxID=67365 RepID=UPI001B8092B3
MSTDQEVEIERLAARVAETGLRNKRAKLAETPIRITGHDSGADGQLARSRADAVAAVFRRHLDRALSALGAAGADLSARGFTLHVTTDGTTSPDPGSASVTIGITADRHSATALRLDELRQAEPGLRDGPFRPAALARRVLGLADATPVTGALRADLYTVTDAAMRDGRAGSLAEVAAYRAEKDAERYADHRFTTGGTRVPGLNWTGLPDGELYADTIGLLEERPGDTPRILDSKAPRWLGGPTPYLLAATMDGDRVTIPALGSTTRTVSAERFVAEVLKDQELAGLPADAPIVLAMPYAGDGEQYLARLLAERTGRTVWAHSGDARLMTTPDGRLAVAVFTASERPVGSWFPVPPGMLPDADDTADTDDGSDEDWHEDVLSSPVGSELTGLQIGRASYPPDHLAVREEDFRHLDQVTKYVHANFATGTLSKTFPLEPAARGKLKAFFAAHGGAGYTSFALHDGEKHTAWGDAGAKWLKKRRSFTGLLKDKEDWLGLVMCQAGSPKDSAVPSRRGYDNAGAFVPNPLRNVAQGQHYANEMRHKTSATTVSSGVFFHNGEYVHGLVTDPQGRWGSYAEFFPEPETDELDRRARAIGLHSGPGPVSEEERQRTLELVRALKLTLGNEVDDDVRIEQDPGYAELLRGAAALERMWREDPRFRQAGPFTLEFFQRVAAAKLSLGQAGPSRADYRAVLAQALGSGPGTSLGDFVTLPPAVDRAVAWLGGPDVTREIADVLRLSGPDEVGEDERSRMFWARVKAHEALGALDAAGLDAYTAGVLHLDPSEVDDARRDQARDLTAAAYGVGRDGADPAQVGAYHLETEQALSAATAMPPVTAGGPATGRHLLATPRGDTAVDLSKVHTPGGTVDAPWHGKTADGSDRPHPYVVRAEPDRNDPGHLFVSYAGVTRRVPAAEFLELVAGDPELLTLDQAVPVFLAVSELDRLAPGLAQDLAQRIGREIYSTEFPVGEHTAGGAAHPVFSLHPSPATGATPTAGDIRVSAPRALDSVSMPGPVPPPPLDADTPGSSRGDRRAPAPTLELDAPVPGVDDPLPGLGGRMPGLDDPLPDLTTALTEVRPPSPPPPPPSPPSTLGPTPPPGQNPRPWPAGRQIDEELEKRRRPRVDSAMLPPPQVHRPSKFTDDTRMPGYVDGFLAFPGDESDDTAMPIAFGQSDVYLRGWERIVEHIDAEMEAEGAETASGEEPARRHRVRGGGIDESVFQRMKRAMRERPQTFLGEGREFVYRAESGRLRRIHIRVRNYGEWTKFTDGTSPIKVDNASRAQASVGGSKTVGQTRQLAPTVPLGPQSAVFSAFGRLGLRLGRIREVNYSMQDQVLNVGETRGWDTSHPYLDDAYVEVRITDAEPPRPAKRGILGSRWRAKPATAAAPDVEFAFGVRHGLGARLPEAVTKDPTLRRTPRTLELGPESDYRLVITEDFGPVAQIRDWAVDRIGAEPDSSAYRELDRFISSRNFHQLAGRMARGSVPGKPLFADDKKRTPLGAFVIERVVPGRAVLASETDKAELRDSAFLTVQNTRKQTKAIAKDFSLVLGPTFNLPTFGLQNVISGWMNRVKPRIQLGPSARIGHTRGRSAMTGGSGAVRSVGRAKNVTTDLYRVEKTVWIRKTGDAHATPFTTWSLDRMTRTEARRLAGMEDENTFGATEPYAPAYLTENHPPTLGMARPVQFLYANGRYSRRFAAATEGEDTSSGTTPPPAAETDSGTGTGTGAGTVPAIEPGPATEAGPQVTFAERNRLDSFTRQVLTAVSRRYPTMVATLEELGDPGDKRWRNHAHYQMVLHNTLTVINALSHHSMAGNLEAMSRTGIRIGLVNPGRFTRGYYHIWIDAELTNRTYVSPTDTILRHSAPGATTLGESQYGVQGAEFGFEALASVRDTAVDDIGFPSHALTGQLGYQAGWQTRDESNYGATATFDQMSISTKPGNLYSYDLSLTVSTGGYWRPRSLLRGLVSFGILGTSFFVRGPKSRGDIIGGDAEVPAVRGKVLLSIPSEHSPKTDPHAPGADNPYLDPNPVTRTPMTRDEARKLLDASTEDGRQPGPLEGVPHQTLSVVADRTSPGIVDRVLAKASHNKWQLTRVGAPAHDAAVRPEQPQFLTANVDQNASATGSRTTGLFGKGPYIDWLATVVHRMRVTNLRALTRPQPMETEMTVGGSNRMSGAQSKSFTQSAGLTAVYGHSHQQGSAVTGNYGMVWRPWWRTRGASGTVIRTVTSDINRVDQGHQVLATGDAEHEVAAEMRSSGVLSPLGAVVRRLRDWAGERQVVKGGWLGHLPERAAHRLGLIRGDDLGGGPTYTRRDWLQPRWFRKAPFATYPVDSVDTSKVVEEFERQLDDLAIDDESREAIHRLTSARVTRALRREMMGTGSAVTARIGGPGWKQIRIGGRNVRIRAQLEPVGEPRFVQLWPRTELEDHRWAVETYSDGFSSGRGSDAGTQVNEGVHTGDTDVPTAGPSMAETGSNRQNVSATDTRVRGRVWSSYTSEPHAEYATRYRLRITMEMGRKRGDGPRHPETRRIEHSGDVGIQREIVPLSLMRPDTARGSAPAEGPDRLAPPEIGDEPTAVNVLTGKDSPLEKSSDITGVLDSWRAITLPDGTQGPFVPPKNGFHVRNVIGAENILAAGTIALAKAYDNRLATTSGRLTGEELERVLRTARITPLTAEGTGSAQVLEDSLGSGALSAFFEHASGNGGYETAGLVENALADRSEGWLRVFSRPDFAGARLMAVADGARMESATRITQSDNATASQGGDHNTVLGAAPALKSDTTGSANPGASGTGADTSDSDGRVIAGDQARQVTVKPNTGRVFAFAIPTAWLSVADVHRQFKDLPSSNWVREHLLGSLGGVKPGPQTVESQTHVLAWVREDVARQLGLITDDNFPETVAKAWDKVKDAAKTWADEDAKYWELRRDLPDLREAVEAARVARSVARRQHREAQAAAGTEYAAARQDLVAATAAADAALTQDPGDFPAPVGDELRSATELAEGARQTLRDALLTDLTDDATPALRAAAEARLESARLALSEAEGLVGSIRRRERDRMEAEARRAFERRTAAADERVAGARDAAHAAAQAFRAAERAVEARITAVRSQERKAENAADALHHLRAQTDRLTRWHRLPEDPPSGEEDAVPTRAGLPEPKVTDWEPGKTERTENPARHSAKPKLARAPKLDSITEEPSAEPKSAPKSAPKPKPAPKPPSGLAPIAEETPEDLTEELSEDLPEDLPESKAPAPDTSDPGSTGDDTGTDRSDGSDTGTDRRHDTPDTMFREEPETSGTPPKYTEVTALRDGAPALKSPEGTTHRLLDVPQGNSFYRAFQRALPAARTGGDGAPLDAAGLRNVLADAVEGLPDDSPLLAYFSPDETDTFTAAELDTAALDLGTDTPQRREFDALGVIPHSAGDRPGPERRYQPLSPAQRRGLAAAQLRRAANAANDTGWDHSAADLLPALAARTYGVGVRVVREDGTYQDFSPNPDRPLPPGAERVVLYVADRHFRAVEAAAVAEGPPPPPKPQPPVDDSLLTAHATRPWTWEGLDDETYAEQPKFDAATDVHTLTDPDGYTYDLVTPLAGEGNLFYQAIAVALGAAPTGGREFEVIDDLTELMDTVPLPRTARLDPRATFTEDELYEAGFRPLDPVRRREFRRGGGRLPESWPTPPDWVRDGLIRAHLRSSRRWSPGTALLAAELVAKHMNLHVTYVHENGTIDTFGTASADVDNAIVLYERGGDY